MVTVTLTPHLQRRIGIDRLRVHGDSVRAALEAAFIEHPPLRPWIVDDCGAPRQHVAIFVDGELIRDRNSLSDAVADGGEIWIMQALSGG